MDDIRERLKNILFHRSFQYSAEAKFKLSSGDYSHYYFNCKRTTLDPEGMCYIGQLFFERIRYENIKGIGGLTLGADPIANAVAIMSYQKGHPINPFVVRKELKDHGIINWIEGNVTADDPVAIVDDVITTGNSTIQAIKRAIESGLIVKKALVLVDREEGGRERISKQIQNVKVEVMFVRSEFMALYEGLYGKERIVL